MEKADFIKIKKHLPRNWANTIALNSNLKADTVRKIATGYRINESVDELILKLAQLHLKKTKSISNQINKIS